MTEAAVCISQMIGEGEAAHRLARVGATSLTLGVGFPDGLERIPARELAKALGYARDRKLFELARRLEREHPYFGSLLVRPTVGRGRNQQARPRTRLSSSSRGSPSGRRSLSSWRATPSACGP